jgi:intracellular multiplication protein IcmP
MASGQRQGNDGNEMDIIYIAGGILLAVAILVFFFHLQIVRFIFFVKYYELTLIGLFSPQYESWAQWVDTVPRDQVTLLNVIYVSQLVGQVMRYPMMLIGIILAVIVYFFHSDRTYRTIETMDSLSDKLRSQFPASQVVSGLNLAATPIEQGPWAMAQTPIEFAKKHKLLYRDERHQVCVDRMKSKMIFSEQLGRPWKGLNDLAPYERAIFGALAAYVGYNRKEADLALESISASVTQEKIASKALNFAHAEKLFQQYSNAKAVQAITEKHAYVLTVFIELLIEARKTGIVANSSYLWVKPIDRPLWYVLNNVGRKAVFIETGAVHGHWLAEKNVGFAIHQPMIDEAIVGLEEAIRSRVLKGDI